jgi:hypothetical protein
MSNEYISDDGPGSDLFDPYETGWWKSVTSDDSAPVDQPCPNCNGEGYIVVRVYPWDGYSYDEKPCEICNPRKDRSELGGKSMEEMEILF